MQRPNTYMQIKPHERPIPATAPPPQNDGWLAMLDALEAQPRTAAALAQYFRADRHHIRRQMHLLHQAHILHIHAWQSTGNTLEPIYARGPGQDAAKDFVSTEAP